MNRFFRVFFSAMWVFAIGAFSGGALSYLYLTNYWQFKEVVTAISVVFGAIAFIGGCLFTFVTFMEEAVE